ncbi:MAG: methyl-accepting chemotaxis protein [Defluviitaleaceae bacterium]|nr:methyl-accepting chemotaxis protein [Defluviitaleaceae bacterium]
MKNLNFRAKIILPTALLVFILLAATLVITVSQFSAFNDYLLNARLNTAANSVREFTNDISRKVIDVGLQISNDPQLAQAVLAQDTQGILRVGQRLVDTHGITFLTVASTDSIILARTDEPNRNGDEYRTASVLNALDGIVSVEYTPVGERQLPIRASVPMYHEGEIIGVLIAGCALDTPKAAELLSARYNAAITIFVDDVRVSSTLVNEQGNSVVGTRITDDDILNRVFRRGEDLPITLDLFGKPYSAYFLPIRDPEGNTLGVVNVALPLEDIYAQRSRVTLIVGGIGVLGLLATLFVIYLISSKLISPIKHLASVVSDVSHGRVNINKDMNLSHDEIGMLTNDVYGLVDVIKSIVDNLSEAHKQYMKVGNVYYQMDTSEYENSFKEVIENVNSLLKENAEDIMSMSGVLNQVSSGNFDLSMEVSAWPGDWAAIPIAVNNLTGNLKGVSAEINTMIDATANKGDLTFKTDAAKYDGDWRKIMSGLNDIAKAVAEPFKAIHMALDEMTDGNFDLDKIDKKLAAVGLESNAAKYRGEFSEVIKAIETTVSEISSYISEITDVLAAVSGGDLTVTIRREYVGSFAAIKSSINNISASLNKTMSEISSASEQVLLGAKQISTSAMDLANGAQQQASAVEELNASVDIINQQTRQNADDASEASGLSNKSSANAKEGNEAMKHMLVAMSQIKESSNDISKIIKVIQDIAFQTNLLALNAAVEAARAGEHGKGFAVVAEEVRSLAARSQTAAEETTGLIGDSIARVDSGSNIAESTSASLDVIVKNANEVMGIISNISASSQEQAEAISQVSIGLGQISQVVQGNSAVSEEAAAASEELNSQAELLQQLVSFFKL